MRRKWFGANFPATVSTSFLGAHALPGPEFMGRSDEYIDVVVREWLPALVWDGLVDAVDAWCADIAFTAAQCERVFDAAAGLVCVSGCTPNNSNVGGSRMAARHRALSCDHLEYTSGEDAEALAAAGTVAVMLPIAFYALAETRLPPCALPPGRCADGSGPGKSRLWVPGAFAACSRMNMGARFFGLTRRRCSWG